MMSYNLKPVCCCTVGLNEGDVRIVWDGGAAIDNACSVALALALRYGRVGRARQIIPSLCIYPPREKMLLFKTNSTE